MLARWYELSPGIQFLNTMAAKRRCEYTLIIVFNRKSTLNYSPNLMNIFTSVFTRKSTLNYSPNLMNIFTSVFTRKSTLNYSPNLMNIFTSVPHVFVKLTWRTRDGVARDTFLHPKRVIANSGASTTTNAACSPGCGVIWEVD